jgi:hypothetical protein
LRGVIEEVDGKGLLWSGLSEAGYKAGYIAVPAEFVLPPRAAQLKHPPHAIHTHHRLREHWRTAPALLSANGALRGERVRYQ